VAVCLAADVVPFSNVVLDIKCRVDFGVNHIELFEERPLALNEKKESAMTTLSNMERMNLSNAKALRRAREQLKVTKVELARRLKVSVKTIDRLENAEAPLDEAKINEVLSALGISSEEFLKAKKGRSLKSKKRLKVVTENSQRRSYKKVMTKEVQVLKTLRKMKGISQDQASSICRYSRPSIGHIENGRIELDQDRIRHIVSSYGMEMSEFNRLMGEEVLRDEVLESCLLKMRNLSEDKLKLIQALIQTF
jgi:transcriptional regulator with XRE-family HTH domain